MPDPSEREMTYEYARLSLEAALRCSHWDWQLKTHKFVKRCRAKAWDLTPELLADWRNEAIRMGIKEDEADPPELVLLDQHPLLAVYGMHLQEDHDKERRDRKKTKT